MGRYGSVVVVHALSASGACAKCGRFRVLSPVIRLCADRFQNITNGPIGAMIQSSLLRKITGAIGAEDRALDVAIVRKPEGAAAGSSVDRR
jgi:hypothetical protein